MEEKLKEQLEELQAQLDAQERENESLKSQRANQNAYITKLEGKTKALESSAESIKQTVNSQPAMDPDITEYFRKKRREDYMDQATEVLKEQVGEEVFLVIKPELDSFLKAYMTEQNVSVKYITDAFHLLLGKAYADKSHPIHKDNEKNPEVKQPELAKTDTAQIATQLNKLQNPGMTPEDQGMTVPPATEPQKAQSTRDAMESFKNRLFSGGLDSTKFE